MRTHRVAVRERGSRASTSLEKTNGNDGTTRARYTYKSRFYKTIQSGKFYCEPKNARDKNARKFRCGNGKNYLQPHGKTEESRQRGCRARRIHIDERGVPARHIEAQRARHAYGYKEEGQHISLKVSQEYFDEIVEKDYGMLTCKGKKFFWAGNYFPISGSIKRLEAIFTPASSNSAIMLLRASLHAAKLFEIVSVHILARSSTP